MTLNRRSAWLTSAALAALLTTAGCGGGNGDAAESSGPKTFTVYGELDLQNYAGTTGTGHGCTGWQGYADIRPGAQVVVTDSRGAKVGVGDLGPGHWGEGRGYCAFAFVVPDVPAGGGIYSVEVTHRGQVSFKETDSDSVKIVLR